MPRPLGEVYGGALGRTRTEKVQVSCPCGLLYGADVTVSIDGQADPASVDRLRAGTLNRAACPRCGVETPVEAPVSVHHAERRLLALVLPAALRHRELEERAAALLALGRERDVAVPAYARDLRVVFGGDGLGALLEELRADSTRAAELEVRARELEARARELEARTRELEARGRDLEARGRELEARGRDLTARSTELEARGRDVEARGAELDGRARSLAERETAAAAELAEEQRREVEAAERRAASDLELARREAELNRRREELDARERGLAERASLGDRRREPAAAEAPRPAPATPAKPVASRVATPLPAPAVAQPGPGAAGSAPAPTAPLAVVAPVPTPAPAPAFAAAPGAAAPPAWAVAPRAVPRTVVTETPVAEAPEEHSTKPFELLEESDLEELVDSPTVTEGPTPGRRPEAVPARTTPTPARDLAVERWMISRAAMLHLVDQGQVRLLASLAPDRLEGFLDGPVAPRIQLHRMEAYPLVVIRLVREDSDLEPLNFVLDIGRMDDRGVLGVLGIAYELTLGLYDTEYLGVLERRLEAPLAENVRYVVTAAEEHLSSVPAGRRSFEKAVASWRAAGLDREVERPPELEEDSFSLLPTPATVRVALQVVAYYSEPANEDHLVLATSFPLEWWRKIRSRVVGRAVEFGLALPPALAQTAIAEGAARSRKELATKLVQAFGEVVSGARPNDLEPSEIQENWRALVADCETLGVPLDGRAGDLAALAVGAVLPEPAVASRAPRGKAVAPAAPVAGEDGAGTAPTPRLSPPPEPAGRPRVSAFGRAETGPSIGDVVAAIASASGGSSGGVTVKTEIPPERPGADADRSPAVAGEIRASAVRRDLRRTSIDELLGLLDDKDLRRDAAVELCRRAEPNAVGPVFGALRRMTRGEAVRVLPAIVAFGERAVPHLLDGLRSRKGFLRQGCALALAVLKSDEGIEPLCELLVTEPTDVWPEVARAIGAMGAAAVGALVPHLGEAASGPAVEDERRDRVALALAHIAARGARSAVEALVSGRHPQVSGAARLALQREAEIRDDDEDVGGGTPRDQTVNRAFSRRFFEAVAAADRAAPAARRENTVQLSEADLEDAAEPLGDDDLLPE